MRKPPWQCGGIGSKKLREIEKNSAEIAEMNVRLAAVQWRKKSDSDANTTDAAASAEEAVLMELEEREVRNCIFIFNNLDEPDIEIVNVDERKEMIMNEKRQT